MKKILFIILPLMLTIAPTFAMGMTDNDGVETSITAASINVNGNTVRVSNTNGEDIEVFNLTGTKITTIKTDTTGKTFTVNLPKGCYLLKIGKVVRKISIR
ncbi:MAG: T9SS type A sorting domain-containing protein [Bacteroidaceae bacterium]|nr:T9SS type A sorting domain-containing protein [Bacteroidaceae bacterium]